MKKALSYLQKIQIAVGGIFLCIFLGSVVIQMACRYAGIAAIWTEDPDQSLNLKDPLAVLLPFLLKR